MQTDQERIDELTRGLEKNTVGANEVEIGQVEAHFDCKLPQQYVDFVLRVDGVYGTMGKNILRLFKVEDLIWYTEFWPEPTPFIIFATNNCNEAWAFDQREAHLPIANIPWIGTIEDAIPHSKTFIEFLERRPNDPY